VRLTKTLPLCGWRRSVNFLGIAGLPLFGGLPLSGTTLCGPLPPSAKRREHWGGPGTCRLANASPVKSVPFKCRTSGAPVKPGA
jgi:hypothetical protein